MARAPSCTLVIDVSIHAKYAIGRPNVQCFVPVLFHHIAEPSIDHGDTLYSNATRPVVPESASDRQAQPLRVEKSSVDSPKQ